MQHKSYPNPVEPVCKPGLQFLSELLRLREAQTDWRAQSSLFLLADFYCASVLSTSHMSVTQALLWPVYCQHFVGNKQSNSVSCFPMNLWPDGTLWNALIRRNARKTRGYFRASWFKSASHCFICAWQLWTAGFGRLSCAQPVKHQLAAAAKRTGAK